MHWSWTSPFQPAFQNNWARPKTKPIQILLTHSKLLKGKNLDTFIPCELLLYVICRWIALKMQRRELCRETWQSLDRPWPNLAVFDVIYDRLQGRSRGEWSHVWDLARPAILLSLRTNLTLELGCSNSQVTAYNSTVIFFFFLTFCNKS